MSKICYQDRLTGRPVSLNVEVHGTGFPVLLIAPGGMKSSIPLWKNAPYNPITYWSEKGFQVVAMDQRNAGQSSGPVSAGHGWETFMDDQIAVLDELGIDKFIVAGMCIGGSYVMQLLHRMPDRAVGGVLFQTIGLDQNRDAFYQMYDGWASALAPTRPDVSLADWAGLRSNMYDSEQFLFCVGEKDLPDIKAPVLVLQGNDLYHPASASRIVASGVPHGKLIEAWKTGADIEIAQHQTLKFLSQIATGVRP